jgi:protein-disulfide isomerase-like protein with CxxC motif
MTPFYKALTANFRNTIAFAHIFKNSTLAQELGVTDFPTLLLNGK